MSQHLHERVLRDLACHLQVAHYQIDGAGDPTELAAKQRLERIIRVVRASRPANHQSQVSQSRHRRSVDTASEHRRLARRRYTNSIATPPHPRARKYLRGISSAPDDRHTGCCIWSEVAMHSIREDYRGQWKRPLA